MLWNTFGRRVDGGQIALSFGRPVTDCAVERLDVNGLEFIEC